MGVRLSVMYADGAIDYFLQGLIQERSDMDYFTAPGNPPGVWVGGGCGDMGLKEGATATKDEVHALFSKLENPTAGEPLARTGDTARRVASYQLTFEHPKSVSVLWALGDDRIRRTIQRCSREAIEDAVDWWTKEVARSRMGKAGALQVGTGGITAARFDHWDSREHDPHLHSHLIVSNFVKRPDGTWGTLDGRVVHAAHVAASERFNTIFYNLLRRELGVEFDRRDGLQVSGKASVLDIDGMPSELITAFSKRMEQTQRAERELLRAERERTGHEPDRKTRMRIHEIAFRMARSPKDEIRSLAQLMDGWKKEAAGLGFDPQAVQDQCIGRPFEPYNGASIANDAPSVSWLASLAATDPAQWSGFMDTDEARAALGELRSDAIDHRTTVTRWNVRSAVCRALEPLPLVPGTEDAIADAVTDRILGTLVPITPHRYHLDPDIEYDPILDPEGREYASADREPEDLWAAPELLDAERWLMDRADQRVGTGVADARRLMEDYDRRLSENEGHAMAADQFDAALGLLESDSAIAALTGPAGTGKTTTARAIKTVFDEANGAGKVMGLATSAKAAEELSRSLEVPAFTVAKILYASDPARAAKRRTLIASLQSAARKGKLTERQRTTLEKAVLEDRYCRIPRNGIVIVDEASMTGTMDLRRLAGLCAEQGARMILTGDPEQLGSVNGGEGWLGWMQRTGRAQRLTSIWRFEDPDEAKATLALHDRTVDDSGAPAAAAMYARLGERAPDAPAGDIAPPRSTDSDAGRIHGGTDADMMQAAYDRTLKAKLAGRAAVLVCATNDSVADLNECMEQDLRDRGIVDASGETLPTRDGLDAARGTTIVTRLNMPSIEDSDGGYVKNGHLWVVEKVNGDGVTAMRRGEDGSVIRADIPAEYLREHAELGYATTVHRCQGMTVDEGNLYVPESASLNRSMLYVAMTRGRRTNHAWLAVKDEETLRESHEWVRWLAQNGRRLEEQGLKPWKGEGPAPSGFYGVDDLKPTAIQLAMSRFSAIAAAGQDRLTATELRDRHIEATHSLDALLAERDAYVSHLVRPRILRIVEEAAGRETAEQVGGSRRWGALASAWARASAIDPAQAAGLLREAMASPQDGDDPAGRAARLLSERMTGGAEGRHPQWVAGSCPPVGPEDGDPQSAAGTLDLIRQADRMIEEAADRMVERTASARAQAWERRLPPEPDEPGRKEEWQRLVRDVILYRRQWNVTADSPLGARPKGAQAEHWRNLADRMVEYRDGLKPGAAAEAREYARALRQAGRRAPDPSCATTEWNRSAGPASTAKPRPPRDEEATERIARTNELIWSHWRDCTPDSPWAARYMEQRGLRPDDAGYAPADRRDTIAWARSAGLTVADLAEAGLLARGSDGYRGAFRDRLCMPIRDSEGRIASFTARRSPLSQDGRAPKYINGPSTAAYAKRWDLYGMGRQSAQALRDGAQPVICEGAMDAQAVARAAERAAGQGRGAFAAFAPCGTSLTEEHLQTLREIAGGRPLPGTLLCFDGDDAGRTAAARAWDLLVEQERGSAGIVMLPEDVKDPGDMMAGRRIDELADALCGARPLWRELIDMSAEAEDLSLPESQADWARRVERIVVDAMPERDRDEARSYIASVLSDRAREQRAEAVIDLSLCLGPDDADQPFAGPEL